MNQVILSMHMWTSLSGEERSKIRALFHIPRSSHVIVSDQRLESDGTTAEDFKHLTVEKMQTYLNDTSEDFHYLFNKVLSRIRGEEPIEVTNAKPEKNVKKGKNK